MQDRRYVAGGSVLNDHPVRKEADVDSVPAHPAAGGVDPKEIPLLPWLDDATRGDCLARATGSGWYSSMRIPDG
jgi:hypothetical protein